MKNLFLACFIVLLLPNKGNGQSFNPETAIKSVVQVWVTNVNGSRERKVLTGFVWKNPNQIITALHGMQPGWKIEVKYANQAAFREAKVTKVLAKADLVMLELKTPQSGNAAVTPINEAFVGKIAFEETMYCLGLAMGSTGTPSRVLSKGFLQPKETLEFLVPPNVKKELMNTSLGLDLDIIYFHNGNLLPSNSGAPIFNNQGKLVGIGNGGLEKGTVNISWAIPAKYISELENSSVSQIPGTVSSNRNMFSSTVFTEDAGANPDDLIRNSNQFRPVRTTDFEFYLTKNRSIDELMETAEDPENIIMLGDEIIRQYNINMNLSDIRLDVYEDIQNGVVVVVPEGLNLQVNDPGTDEEALQVSFRNNDFTALAFAVAKNNEVEDINSMGIDEVVSFLDEFLYTELAQALGIPGFMIIEEYTVIDDGWDSGRKKINIMAAGTEGIISPMDGRQYGILTYVTLLADEENLILTTAVTALPSDLVINAQNFGLNCMGVNGGSEDCTRIRDMFTAFTAAHLSTFAY